ncbi:acetoacetate decarboxylase family protein [Natronorubrum sp. A-ect3]|uniref:acetoacetate decarboxylase family protein n=1 Tax=Natronorubrum sp. A-ect3 TaxID=3242698 RepID=UPI00359DF05C
MDVPTGDRSRVTLSTGHEIELPLALSCTVGGVTVPAQRRRLEAMLPAPLTSLAIAPGVGCVTLAGIQYHRVGGRGDERETAATSFEPYDEFAVIVPAVRGSRTTIPLAQLVGGEVGGYVHWLPVTTEASVALGREIWGYPKERAAITVTDGPRGIHTVVDDTAGARVRLEVPRPRARVGTSDRDVSLWSYTTMNGKLLRSRMRIQGEITVGTPLGTTLEISPQLQAVLGLWNRPLARLHGVRVHAWLFDGEPVAVVDGT